MTAQDPGLRFVEPQFLAGDSSRISPLLKPGKPRAGLAWQG
jgi:hypothetical protein